VISRPWRWFRKAFALDRRYGVRFQGGHERTGFLTQRHAEGWARDRGFPSTTFVVFFYEPLDLRFNPAEQQPKTQESYRP